MSIASKPKRIGRKIVFVISSTIFMIIVAVMEIGVLFRRRQRAEVRGQKAEVRGQRSEGRGQ